MIKRFVVTANRTKDGAPLYLRADKVWSEALSDALVTADATTYQALLEWARTQEFEVCDPYRLEVVVRDGAAAPISARERIRAAGAEATLRALGLLFEVDHQRAHAN